MSASWASRGSVELREGVPARLPLPAAGPSGGGGGGEGGMLGAAARQAVCTAQLACRLLLWAGCDSVLSAAAWSRVPRVLGGAGWLLLLPRLDFADRLSIWAELQGKLK